jgi:hypothetical protein
VGDHHDGLAELAVELLQQAQDLVGGLAVEVAGGLVADQQRGSETSARAIATRCCWPPDSSLGLWPARSDRPTSCSAMRARGALGAAQRGQQQRQLDVLLRRQHRHQVVALEDEADVLGAPGGQRVRCPARRCAGRRRELAGAGRVEAADQVEQGGLARARRPHQRDEVALGDVQVDAVQHLDALGAADVGLGQAADLDQRPAFASTGRQRLRRGDASAVGEVRRRRQHHDRAVGHAVEHAALGVARLAQRHRLALGRTLDDEIDRGVGAVADHRAHRHPDAAGLRAAAGFLEEAHPHAHVGDDARVAAVERDAHLHRRLAAVGGRDDGDHRRRDRQSGRR